ncbi:hypothetical protein FEK30_01165, partial (plasmid) [Picosynechococcus sp. PCC 11901]
MFFPKLKKGYLYNESEVIQDPSSYEGDINLPLVMDTEFTGKRRIGITVQVKSIIEKNEDGAIFDHQDFVKAVDYDNEILRHKAIETDFAAIDFLRLRGHDANIRETSRVIKSYKGNRLPILQIDVYSHFALAELFIIFGDTVKKHLKRLIWRSRTKQLELKRRLRTLTRYKGSEVSDAIELPFLIDLDGKTYRFKLRIIDSCALHGVASYAQLAETVGIKLSYKDNLTQDDKENMIQVYRTRPKQYDEYALGDLSVYDILRANADLFKLVWDVLGVSDHYKLPSLTIGSSIHDLFKGVIFNRLGIDPLDKDLQKFVLDISKFASANHLKYQVNTTGCLLAKVAGGRCRNNRPLVSFSRTNLVDIDISGAYGNGLRHQIFPIGKPVIEEYPANSEFNGYKTLRQWLKSKNYGGKKNQLVDGLWIAIVSTEGKKLKTAQDFLISWFDFRYEEIADMTTDVDCLDVEINPKTGKTKILNNEVVDSVITSDFIEWLMNICNKKQRDELLDN